VSQKIIIRKYEPKDRLAVRNISCLTADCGNPIDGIFNNYKFVADVLTLYYTDYEPNSTFVAENKGQIVGYLTGCMDGIHYQKVMKWKILPKLVFRGLVLGAIINKQIWQILKSATKTLKECYFSISELLNGFLLLNEYPAHMHINLLEGFRRKHIGEKLVNCFLKKIKLLNIKGVHVKVRSDNTGGSKFFEKMGFIPFFKSKPIFLYRDNHLIKFSVIMYGKKL